METKVDCSGSRDLSIVKSDEKKLYIKKVKYIYKYLIKYLNSISNVLDIPVIKYDFIEENNNYYIVSKCFDELVDFDKILLSPFYYNNTIDGIYMMKEYTLKFNNGCKIYNEYLKQLILSVLINDADRTIDNIKLYVKGNNLILAPYMDIHLMMNADNDLTVFYDEYYLEDDKAEEFIEESEIYTNLIELKKNFYDEYKFSYYFAFNQFVFGDCLIDEFLDILYQELEDKTIFDKIINLNLEQLLDKSNVQENAYMMIETQFNIAKDEIEKLLKRVKGKKK